MSSDIKGGLDYALVKRHYDCDDYTAFRLPIDLLRPYWFNGLAFTATEDYYVVGFLAALHDPTVIDPTKGWTTYTHGRSVAPAWLTGAFPAPLVPTIMTALGLSPWPAQLPAFEAKDILFWADQDCWVRFEGSSRVQHFIPANTYMRFHRRCFIFYVVRDTADGTLRVWMEG